LQIRSLLIAAAALCAAAAHGDDGLPPLDCANPQNTYEIGQCASQDGEAAEAALNQVYGQLMAVLAPEAQKPLRDAQRLWLRLRDADCALEGTGAAGGTLHSVIVRQCDTAMARQRAETLRRWLDCQNEEGNPACPAFK